MEVRVQYKSMNESHNMMMEIVGNLHTSTANENEVLKKEVEALRADKEIKDEQLNMFTIAEDAKEKRKGLVIGTEEILGSSSQQEQPKHDDEVNTSNVETTTDVETKKAEVEADVNVEVSLDIVVCGEVKDISHSEWASLRKIEVERHRLRVKMNKFKVLDEDKEIGELFGDEDEEDDDNDKDDKDDKDKKDEKDDKDDDDDDD
ncbi:hypothetical protein Hanom_Chr07g00616781 [Helianthus anomalus]